MAETENAPTSVESIHPLIDGTMLRLTREWWCGQETDADYGCHETLHNGEWWQLIHKACGWRWVSEVTESSDRVVP